mgnify:CR=1 FL=1|tara:strand:- start:217 stop:933 length:717 start_codon:yes stop_codon:yes gene_type:complete
MNDLSEQGLQTQQDRLDRLSRYSADQRNHNSTYTLTVRRLRLLLPLAAVAIITALLTWPSSEKEIAALQEEQRQALKTVRKNELTKPEFQSMDDKNQPYTIAAEKAIQDENDETIMLLTKPVGEVKLTSGKIVNITANDALYKREDENVELNGDVILNHQDGYRMTMSKLYIDLAEKTALAEVPVHGVGPEGTIKAQGLQGDNAQGILIFTGPAELILKNTDTLSGLANPAAKNSDDG